MRETTLDPAGTGPAAETAPAALPLLPEGYYLDNFQAVLETVRERYADLLHPQELLFFDDWSGLSLGARRLYVRLVSRKGPLFRRDRVAYSEIPDLSGALQKLAEAAFVDAASDAATEELLALLLREELLALARELLAREAAPARTAARPEVLRALLENAAAEALGRAVRARFDVIRPLRQEQVVLFRLLFFGNLRQDWTEFVLRDLGVLSFEPYELRRDLRLFPDRRAIDDTLALTLCRGEVRALVWAGEVEEARERAREVLGPSPRRDAWHPASRRYFDGICNRLGRALERRAQAGEGPHEAALAFYRAAVEPPARERRARVLAALGRHEEALELCRAIRETPRDESEAVFAPRFESKILRLRGERVALRRPRRETVEIAVEKKDGTPVEALALKAFAASGRAGFFSENWLFKTLFGLAFWDIVFAPVAGAFEHPFQHGPLDLGTPEFRRARAALIDERLAEIREEVRLAARLFAVYDEKYGTANPFVAWGEELRPHLELALRHLSGPQLAAVFDRLSRDVRRYRRGFPDLFVLRDEAPGFELLEVKGPGDQLRPEQGAWIDYLNACALPARILRVSWASTAAPI